MRRSQGRMRISRKPSITTWPARVPVSVEDWPEADQRDGENHAGQAGVQQRRQQPIRLLNFRHHDVRA